MAGWHDAAIVSAGLLDRLESELGPDAVVGAIALVVEVDWVNDDGDQCNSVIYRCSDGRRWVQYGLFSAAAHATNI